MTAITLEGRIVAGFWTRFAALSLDLVLWSVLTTALSLALVALAPRTFGLSSAPLMTHSCEPLASVPPDLARHVPFAFTADAASRCTSSLAGFRFRTELVVEDEQDEGSYTVTRKASFQVDANLKPIRTYDLDTIAFVGFFVYLVLAQGRARRTLGKRLLRLSVIDQGGRAPGLKAALIRNAILFAPIAAAALAVYAAAGAGWLFTWPVATMAAVAGGLGLSMLALAAQIWWTARRGLPSLHDRLARTLVVRLPA